MNLSAIIGLAGVALRILEEAPALVSSVESFWRSVIDEMPVPPHVAAAMETAIQHVKNGNTEVKPEA